MADENVNAPIGQKEIVNAPWGAAETVYTHLMQDFTGSRIKYAIAFNPKHNKHVRCSVFKLTVS